MLEGGGIKQKGKRTPQRHGQQLVIAGGGKEKRGKRGLNSNGKNAIK